MDKFKQALEEQQQVTKLFRAAVKIVGYDCADAMFNKEGLNDDFPPIDAVERAGQLVDELMNEAFEDAEDYEDTLASIRPGGIQ